MQRLIRPWFVLALAFTFMLQAAAAVAVAALPSSRGGPPAEAPQAIPIEATPEAPATPAAPAERADLRSASTRTFEHPDDTFTAELFSYPIPYQAPGDVDEEWVPIEVGFEESDKPGAVASRPRRRRRSRSAPTRQPVAS